MKRPSPPAGDPRGPARRASLADLLPVWGALVALVGVAFAPVLGNGFVAWDDPQVILANETFRGLGWDQVRFAFSTFNFGLYQPLGWLFLGATYELFGLDPRGYHLACLLFHAANVVLLHLLCVRFAERMTGVAARRGATLSWLCAVPVAIYAVHPLRVELVAWASSQAYLPGVTFSLLALLAYLRANPPDSGSRRGWLAASSALVVLAVLSKGSAVVLPAVFLICDAYPLRRLGAGRPWWPALRAVLVEKVPVLLFCLALAAVAFAAKRGRVEPEVATHPVIVGRVAQASYGAWFYLAKTAWPFGITAFYPRPERGDFRTLPFGACVAALAVALAVVVRQGRRWPWLLATVLAYLTLASPYLGLARVGITLASDRYGYAPTMAWVVLGAAGLVRLGGRRWSRPAILGAGAGAVAVVLGLMALASTQCRVWRDSLDFWSQALAHAPDCPELHNFLAETLAERGDAGRAIDELHEALRLRPDYFEALLNLGIALDGRGDGDGDAALGSLRAAERLRPDDPRVHHQLGALLLGRRDVAGAIVELTRARDLRPGRAATHALLAGALVLQGRPDEAVAEYRAATRLDPEPSAPRVSLALTLARLGRTAEAEDQLRAVVRRDPRNAEAHHILGVLLAALDRPGAAASELAEAIRLRPDDRRPRQALARLARRRP